MNDIEKSVFNLAKSFFEFACIQISNPEKSDEFDIFTDGGTNVELRHDWESLSQKDANLAVSTLSEASTRLIAYLEDINKIKTNTPNLKLRR